MEKIPITSNSTETVRLFNNPFLERLSHVQPLTLLYLYTPFISYFSYLSISHFGWSIFMLEFIFGILLWTLLEYLIHRFIFHYDGKNNHIKKFSSLVHGTHHAYPNDFTRLVSPPLILIPFLALLSISYFLIFGKHFLSIFTGTFLGYLFYDFIHYSLHRFNHKNRIFKYLKRYHFTHHYFDGNNFFGVSTPLWDRILRTKPYPLSIKSRDPIEE